MTTAQPGQEQRMVTEAMINAGGTAVMKSAHLTGCERAKLIYAAMEAARPTADLGEDGELVDWLNEVRTGTHGDITLHSGMAAIRLGKARDRLILYREALDRARFWFAGYVANGGKGADEELEALRAVLSRSGR